MSNTALITGASSGIGREFARYHAGKGGDLIVTARRLESLNTLKAELEDAHRIKVTVIAQDLGSAEQAEELYQRVTETGQPVDILINNAGFGGHGKFHDRDLATDLGMIDLNVKALVTLCHRVGGDMRARSSGRILNVSSTAAYMPGPLQATYFATKSFVSSFSQALAEELRDAGVTVTALEPGFVETEFADRADLNGTDLTSSGATPDTVAQFGYDAMLKGQLRAVNDRKLGFALNWVIPNMPRRQMLKMVRKMQEKNA